MTAGLRRLLWHNFSLKVVSLLLAMLLYVFVHTGRTERAGAVPSRPRAGERVAPPPRPAEPAGVRATVPPEVDVLIRSDGRLDLDRGKGPD